jgi:3'-phosphoadenosine 5'-phosphosulfate sulfotransferase (PAPS reductase)/FAD synthetase
MSDLRILSLGAGVQSSTLALMIEKGEVPMVDAAIFADTMAEPKEVYDHLTWLEKQLSYPIYKVSGGDLTQDSINNAEGKGRWNFVEVPLFTKNNETGKKGLLRRQCTSNYKIRPVNKKIRELLGLQKGEKRKQGTNVQLLMGISFDEIIRMKTNQIKWIENVYPLIDKKIRRKDCQDWFAKHYDKNLPRSACIYCPYKTNTEWKALKNNFPNEWKQAVEFDKKIRTGTKTDDKVYVHKDCVPLNEADLRTNAEKGQPELFHEDFGQLDNCEGMCGV